MVAGRDGGVDTSHEALACRLLIARGAVHLSREEQSGAKPRLERVVKLCRVEEIVLYGIAGTVDTQFLERRNLPQRLYLYLHWHRRGEAVKVHLIGVRPLRFEEEWVGVLVGECHQLCLHRRAVARADRLYLSVEKGRILQSGAQHIMTLAVCLCRPARQEILRAWPAWRCVAVT